jgi:predicted lipid carrier protein YhbT
MRNSGHEAKRLWLETGKLKGLMTTVLMDRKADNQALFFERQRQRNIL